MADELTPEEQEEFEFRARAEHEARAGKAAVQQPAPDVMAGAVEPAMGEKILGAAKTAYDVGAPLVKEHPVATAYAGSYIPGLNQLPILRDIKNTREAVGNIVKRGTNLINNMPVANPVGTPTNPIGGAPVAPTQVAQAAEQPGMLQRASQLYNRYAPALAQRVGQAAEAMAPVGRVLEPIAKLGGVGGQALFHSGGLNTNEDQILAQLRAASLQKNPSAVTSGFTQELQALEQNRKRK